jgi:hypothetical protein
MQTLVQDDEYVLQHVGSYRPYAACSIHLFGTDQIFFQYLVGVKYLTRSGTCHFFLEAYHFSYLVVLAPLVCVTKLGVLDSKIDRKIMRQYEKDNMGTLYLY